MEALMTYKEYIATKPRFVYHGESETELKEKLENITGYKEGKLQGFKIS